MLFTSLKALLALLLTSSLVQSNDILEFGPNRNLTTVPTVKYLAYALNNFFVPVSETVILKWAKVSYDAATITSCNDVTFADASGEIKLQGWDGLVLKNALQYTAKVFKKKLYALTRTALSGSGADTVRTYSLDGSYQDIDISGPLKLASVGSGCSLTSATHTFVVQTFKSDTVAFLLVNEVCDGITYDAIIALSMSSGKTVPTFDGSSYFSLHKSFGTESSLSTDTIYAIEYDTTDATQWHSNGINRFMALGGTKVMVYTSLDIASACIFSDPWSISAPSILQRFGFNAPPSIATDHVFGLAPGDPVITGMHNAYYRRTLAGKYESLSLFVNGVVGSSSSWVYEIDLNLIPEQESKIPADSVFDVKYSRAPCDFTQARHGGSLPIWQDSTSRVWIVTSNDGFWCVDELGTKGIGFETPVQPGAYYDPFIVY